MQKTSLLFRTLFTAVTILTLCPAIAQGEISVQIKTVPDQAVLPLEVEFEAVVSGGTAPYSYVWGFGDGGTSSLVKDSHYYRESGQFTVRLTVFDALDDFGFVSKTITVSSSIFDPKNAVFSVYTNTDDVMSIMPDNRDKDILWVATGGGLIRLNTITNEKKIYINEIPGTAVQSLIQLSDGKIWIGASGGLVRFDYDNDQWTVYNTGNSELPSDFVFTLLHTSDGAIWAGTKGGLVRFDYETNQWTVYNTGNSGLPHSEVTALLQASDGAVWAGTQSGLVRFDYEANQWRLYNITNYVYSLLQTTDGAIWAGTLFYGLVRFDYGNNQWTVYNTDNSEIPSNDVYSLLQTSDGTVWASGRVYLTQFDYDKKQWTTVYGTISGHAIAQPYDGTILTGGFGYIIRFDYGNKQWMVYNISSNGLPDNQVYSFLQTSDGALWAGTNHGIGRFDYDANQWTAYDPNYLFEALLQTSDGAVWAGQMGGLVRFDRDTDQWTVYDTRNSGLPFDEVTALIQASDGAVWVGTGGIWAAPPGFFGGLARFDYDANQWTVYNTDNSELPSISVEALFQTSDGTLWIGTYNGGLARFDYDSNQWTIYNTGNSELPDNWVQALLQTSDGALWAGTAGGLAQFDFNKNQWRVYRPDNSGLPSNIVYSLLQTTDGALWVGTADGLVQFDYKTDQWTIYNINNSNLSSNVIYSLVQTSDNSIWAGGYGLNRISFPTTTQSPGHLILLAGGGAAQTNPLWKTTKELATSVYRIFSSRGFKNTDIFFMSPEKWNDFNGDGYDDHIVDRPMPDEDRNLTVADLEYAITDRAVKAYTPGTPLYLYIIDHGYADDGIKGPSFMISPGEILYADDLNAMLNTYENETGGQVIVINESCYSGAFMSRLKKPGRIVITSASDHIVNYDNYGSDSFTHHFLRYLFENSTIHQAFSKSVRRLQESNLTFYQTPQLDDNGDGKYDDNDGMLTATLRLGGDFATGAPWPEILSLEKGPLSGTSVSFTLATNARMKRVWGTVQPPGYIPDTGGNYQNIELEFFNLSDNDDDLTYTGTYDKFTEKGQYILSFYIKDQFGNVAQSAPVRTDVNVSPGDVNGDGDVTLADAVLSLKICAGEDMSGQNISTAADVNTDGKIGIAEAVFVLRKTAGL